VIDVSLPPQGLGRAIIGRVIIEGDQVGLATETTLIGVKDQVTGLKGVDVRTLTDLYNRLIAMGILDAADVRINPAKEDGNLARLDITLSTLRDALLAEEAIQSYSTGLALTVAQSINLDTKGHKILEVYAKSTVVTTFRLDCSPDNVYWIADYKVYSAVAEVKDTLWNGFRYIRLRSDAAGAAGDTVDLVLAAK